MFMLIGPPIVSARIIAVFLLQRVHDQPLLLLCKSYFRFSSSCEKAGLLCSSCEKAMDSHVRARGSVAQEVGATQKPLQLRKKIEGQPKKTEGMDE